MYAVRINNPKLVFRALYKMRGHSRSKGKRQALDISSIADHCATDRLSIDGAIVQILTENTQTSSKIFNSPEIRLCEQCICANLDKIILKHLQCLRQLLKKYQAYENYIRQAFDKWRFSLTFIDENHINTVRSLVLANAVLL